MVKKKSAVKKSTAKKKGSVKKTSRPVSRKRASVAQARLLSKLDPLLICGASRASSEKAKDIRSALSAKTLAPAGLPFILPLGAHSLSDRMSPQLQEAFAEKDLVTVLIDAANIQEVEKKVRSWKGRCRRLTSQSISAEVPRARLMSLAKLKAVKYVESSFRLEPHCDLAHISANLVVNGSRPDQTGKDVLIGVVDTGIDTSHPAFKKNNKTRILKYIDQVLEVEYDQTDINAGNASQSKDEIGHGTHVAGIAAGNGNPNQQFAGVAPEADIAMVKTTFDSTKIMEGVKDLFDLADQLGKPCVVNLSLGGHFGGHDGTSVTERTIDQLSGPGRIVVASAGNEGNTRLHAHVNLTPNQPQPARWVADLELNARLVQNQILGLLVVQVWHQHEDNIRVQLRSPNGELFEPPLNGTEEFDRGVLFVEANHQVAAYSGDHVTTFTIVTVPQPQWLSGWSIIATESQPGGVRVGTVHSWILNRGMGEFTEGATKSHLVGMPGTAFSAVTVASYATRKEWTSADPNNRNVVLDAVNLEEISYFSSPGPTRDGHNKPEIAAPGQWLISALSGDASTTEIPLWTRVQGIKYTAMQGTSMSAPYVTGSLALLLQKHPTMDWAEAKRRLMKSAKQDASTQPCWNNRWGYGKLDVDRLLNIEP